MAQKLTLDRKKEMYKEEMMRNPVFCLLMWSAYAQVNMHRYENK